MRSDTADSFTGTITNSGAFNASASNITDAKKMKLGRSSTQYVGFYGDASGNVITSISPSDNPKDNLRFQTSINGGSSASKTWTLNGANGTIWHSGNDGSGSGLFADNLDGISSGSFLRSDANDSASGELTLNGKVNIRTGLDLADLDYLYFGSSDDVRLYFNSNGWLYCNFVANGIIFQDNGTEKMRLEDSGIFRPSTNNTGTIGTSSYYWDNGYFQDFNVSGTINVRGAVDLADNDILRFGNSDDMEIFHSGGANYIDLNNGGLAIRDGTSTRFNFEKSGAFRCEASISPSTDRKAVTYNAGSGNVGLNFGPTGTIDHHRYNTNASQAAYWLNRTGSGTAKLITFRYAATQTSTAEIASIRFNNSGAGVTYQTGSDYRLKQNIVDMTNGIERIKQVQPKEYEFKSSPDTRCEGFIAHELQQFVPGAVSGTKDETVKYGRLLEPDGTVVEENALEPGEEELTVKDAEGKSIQRTWEYTHDEPEYQGVDYGMITPLLTQALKEAIEKIEVLEQRLADAGIA